MTLRGNGENERKRGGKGGNGEGGGPSNNTSIFEPIPAETNRFEHFLALLKEPVEQSKGAKLISAGICYAMLTEISIGLSISRHE